MRSPRLSRYLRSKLLQNDLSISGVRGPQQTADKLLCREGSCSSEVASSKDDEERLESAVRTLKALLPESAIRQLQSHASYGLVDMMQSQPLTPPPTPTSTVTTDNN